MSSNISVEHVCQELSVCQETVHKCVSKTVSTNIGAELCVRNCLCVIEKRDCCKILIGQ